MHRTGISHSIQTLKKGLIIVIISSHKRLLLTDPIIIIKLSPDVIAAWLCYAVLSSCILYRKRSSTKKPMTAMLTKFVIRKRLRIPQAMMMMMMAVMMRHLA